MARNTSASDNGAYPEFCYIAAKHDEVFQNFKRHPVYNAILEHVTSNIGKSYLEILLNNPDLKLDADKWKIFLQNDSVGNPRVARYKFEDVQLICSPTTLRYIKVLSDIISLFDTKKIHSISEIGVGYAGQCRILMNVLPIDEYNLIDLPEALALAERFLNELNSNQRAVKYIDGTHLYHDVESDLFISNYAFSELNRAVQDTYIEKVLLKAKAGYITWNGAGKKVWGTDGYDLEEILEKLPNSSTIEEKPLTLEGNCIIVWGTK